MKANQLLGVLASLCAVSIGTQNSLAGGGEPCPDCVIEVHAIADAALFAQLGSGTEDYIRDVIDGMDAVWSMPTSAGGMGVGVVLSEFTFYEKSDPWVVSTDAGTLLPNVKNYVALTYPINADGRDVVLMFSGLDFDGSTVGLSFINQLCDSSGVGILEANSFSLEWVTNVANHQLGHIAGAGHDGSGNACDMFAYIMGSSANPANPSAVFSSCTVQYFSDYIQNSSIDIPACLEAPVMACAADLTGEGDLNFLDVSAFLSAFGSQDPVADFTGEGDFNFLDVSAFLAAFGAGCP